MLLVLSVAGTGCGEEEGALTPRHPLVGRYALTTQLDTFVRPSTEPCGFMYCYEYLPPGDATLEGVLEIPAPDRASAQLERHDPYLGNDGPASVAGSIWLTDPLMLWMDSGGTYIALSHGVLAGDSITGDLTWQLGSRHTYYYGSFVARRIAPE